MLGGQFEKEVGRALTGSRIDLATVTLDEGHQPLISRETLCAEKQQVLKEMRQARPWQRHIVTARRDP
ncbi:hypothetical protein D3C73_851210 [compost metagenome]